MAINVVRTSTGNAHATSCTVTLPSKPATGNLLLAMIGHYYSDTITPPTGWTHLGTTVGTNHFIDVYYHFVQSADSITSWTFNETGATTDYWGLVLYEISGVDQGAPFPAGTFLGAERTVATSTTQTTNPPDSTSYLPIAFWSNGSSTSWSSLTAGWTNDASTTNVAGMFTYAAHGPVTSSTSGVSASITFPSAITSDTYILLIKAGTALAVTPTSINVTGTGTGTATISGGTPPYSIVTAPSVSVATAALSGTNNATVTVTGVATGATSMVVGDSSVPQLTQTIQVTDGAQNVPKVVNVGNGGNGVHQSTAYTVSLGATPTQGNLILVILATSANTVTYTQSGFTALDTTGNNVYVYYKIAGAGEPSSWTFTPSALAYMNYTVYEISGINTSAPIAAHSRTSGTGTNATSGSVTPSDTQPYLPIIAFATGTVASVTQNGSGWTQDFYISNSSANQDMYVGSQRIGTVNTSAVSDSITYAASVTWYSDILLIAPASSNVPFTTSPTSVTFNSQWASSQSVSITGGTGTYSILTNPSGAVASAAISGDSTNGGAVVITPVAPGTTSVVVQDTSGHSATVTIKVYGPLTVSTATADFSATGTISVSESQYTGTITASVGDTTVCTISPASQAANGSTPVNFTVTPVTGSGGTTTITFSDDHGGQVYTQANVTGPLSVSVTTLTFSNLGALYAQTFTASETDDTSSITASSSNTSIATVSQTLDSPGSATFSVSPVAFGTCNITVSDGHGGTRTVAVTVQSLMSVSPPTLNLTAGGVTGVLTISGANGTVSHSSSDPTIANVVSGGTSNGTVVVQGYKSGTVTLTFTDASSNTATASIVVSAPLTAQTIGAKLYIFQPISGTTTNYQLVDVVTANFGGQFKDGVNGGGGQATLILPRTFFDTGKINYDYRVQMYLPDSTHPWYDGYVAEFDQEQIENKDSEQITIQCEGWAKFLGRAILTEELTPSAQAGTMTGHDYLNHVISTYMDSSHFGGAYLDSALTINLDHMMFDGEELNRVIDDVLKQIQDQSGNTWEWWIRSLAGSLPALVVQPNQNPNKSVVGRIAPTPGAFTASFLNEFNPGTTHVNNVKNDARNVYNMIALYGGKDPYSQAPVYGAFKDSTSIALYGLRQKKVTNQSCTSQKTLSNYAAAWILQNGYPQAQRTYKRPVPTDALRGGVWVQIWDGNVPGLAQSIHQMRAIEVSVIIDPQYGIITQEAQCQAPLPYIDNAYYAAIQNARNAIALAEAQMPIFQLAQSCVLSGFNWLQAFISSTINANNANQLVVQMTPAQVQVAATGAPWPVAYSSGSGTDNGNWDLALQDSVSGAIGDGYYEVVFCAKPMTVFGIGSDSTAQYVVVKGKCATDPNTIKGWGFTVSGNTIVGSRDLRMFGGVSGAMDLLPDGLTVEAEGVQVSWPSPNQPISSNATAYLTTTLAFSGTVDPVHFVNYIHITYEPAGGSTTGQPGKDGHQAALIPATALAFDPGGITTDIELNAVPLALPTGAGWDIHIWIEDYGGNMINVAPDPVISIPQLSMSVSALPAMPTNARIGAVNGTVKAIILDAGAAGSTSNPNGWPVVEIQFTLYDGDTTNNTMNAAPVDLWGATLIGLVRVHSQAPAYDITTYTKIPQAPPQGFFTNGQTVTIYVPVAPNNSYDFGFTIADAQGNVPSAATHAGYNADNHATQLYSNLYVTPLGSEPLTSNLVPTSVDYSLTYTQYLSGGNYYWQFYGASTVSGSGVSGEAFFPSPNTPNLALPYLGTSGSPVQTGIAMPPIPQTGSTTYYVAVSFDPTYPLGTTDPGSAGTVQLTFFNSTNNANSGDYNAAQTAPVYGTPWYGKFTIYMRQTNPFSAEQLALIYSDGLIVCMSSANADAVSAASGGSGGGVVKGGCPEIDQIIERLNMHTGQAEFVPAHMLRVGDALRDPITNGWNKVLKAEIDEAEIWEVEFETETIRVDESHLFQDIYGVWINVKAIVPGEPRFHKFPSGIMAATAVRRVGPGRFVHIKCEKQMYVLGQTISHNVKAY